MTIMHQVYSHVDTKTGMVLIDSQFVHRTLQPDNVQHSKSILPEHMPRLWLIPMSILSNIQRRSTSSITQSVHVNVSYHYICHHQSPPFINILVSKFFVTVHGERENNTNKTKQQQQKNATDLSQSEKKISATHNTANIAKNKVQYLLKIF